MVSGVRYRVAGVVGTIVAVVCAVWFANLRVVQEFLTSWVPLVSRLQPTVLGGDDFLISVTTASVVVVAALVPMYKPRPRRILNAVYHTQRRVAIAGLALATIGYSDYTYELPRVTLLATVGTLLVVLPAWFVAIRRTPDDEPDRAIIVGDHPDEIERLLDAIDVPVLGYVAPPNRYVADSEEPITTIADGSGVIEESALENLECLGGLSRLDEILVDYDVDTAVFAFGETDRQEFFGALATCHDHGVAAKIHREKADRVLVSGNPGAEIVDIDVEPWDWQDRVVKRAFDIGFSVCGLLVLVPVIGCITATIKLEDGGSVLYRQDRTAELGETFSVYKFRSMIENAEDETGAKLSEEDRGEVDPRVTRVGRMLRRTHLDEIPQLWSILIGDMSVVGPRPERPELEGEIQQGEITWQQRWFVKPGLTGLAQINNVTGHEPGKKLRYDVGYIRRQSLRYDLAIVIRQMWKVATDIKNTTRPDG